MTYFDAARNFFMILAVIGCAASIWRSHLIRKSLRLERDRLQAAVEVQRVLSARSRALNESLEANTRWMRSQARGYQMLRTAYEQMVLAHVETALENTTAEAAENAPAATAETTEATTRAVAEVAAAGEREVTEPEWWDPARRQNKWRN
jgi:hypothetical protein